MFKICFVFGNARHATASDGAKRCSNMISFGIMSGLLVIMACVVHYDLLGWFPTYPRAAVHEAHDRGPDAALDFEDGLWIPRPGTDPYVASYPPRSTVLVHDYEEHIGYDEDDYDDDDDDFWTEVSDADDSSCTAAVGNGDETGTCAATGGADDRRTWSEHDRTVTGDVRAASYPPVPDDDGGDPVDHDDGDYAATGEERDDDVF